MGIKFSNNAGTTVSADVTSDATSILVNDASEFPTLGAGDWCYATIIGSIGIEIVKVTAITGNNMIVERAKDNTSALAFISSDRFELRNNAAMFEDITAAGDIADGEVGNAQLASDAVIMTHSGATVVIDAGVSTYNFIYNTNFLAVYLNRMLLQTDEYTATNGTSITIGITLDIDDEIEILTLD
jgi:hypothetical protein